MRTKRTFEPTEEIDTGIEQNKVIDEIRGEDEIMVQYDKNLDEEELE